jgi:hypothetical protein
MTNRSPDIELAKLRNAVRELLKAEESTFSFYDEDDDAHKRVCAARAVLRSLVTSDHTTITLPNGNVLPLSDVFDPKHYQNGADSCACGNLWPCTRMTGPSTRRPFAPTRKKPTTTRKKGIGARGPKARRKP